jgi:hypothetical protein
MWTSVEKRVLWWLCLFLAPAVLLSIELFHPAGFTKDPGMFEYLSKPQPYNPQFKALGYFGPPWWFLLHSIQTPLVGLVAVGLWLLASEVPAAAGTAAKVFAWLSRISTFLLIIYYTALDSIGGIGLGRTLEWTNRFAGDGQLNPDQVQGVATVLNATWTDKWVGGVGSWISLTGSWAAFFSAFFLAVALFLAKRAPWPALLLLVAFGWELQVSHTMPHGPIAFGLLIVAAAWMWFLGRPAAPATAAVGRP